MKVLLIENILLLIYLGILSAIALTDWKTRRIPNRFHWMILLLAAAELWLQPALTMSDHIVGGVIVSVPMLLLSLIAHGSFGGGDIKLMAVSGLFLGTKATICAMIFAILSGGFYSVVMLKCGKYKKKDQFAFGPFLAFGLAVAALWGERITARHPLFF